MSPTPSPRDLRLFYLFRLLSTSYLFVPVSIAYALSRGLGLGEVMALSSIYCLTVIVAEVPTGALADRLGRRPAMMAGALAMIAACGLFSVATDFASFAAAEVLAALSLTLCSGADSAYLFDLVDGHKRGDEYARREGSSSAWHHGGSALAFAAGGFLGAQDLVLPYLATGGVAALAFVVALCMRPDAVRPVRTAFEPRAYLAHVRTTLREVARRRSLVWTIACSALVFTLLRATTYIYQPFLDSAGFDVAGIGLVFAAVYLVSAVVSANTDALRRRFGESMLLGALLTALVTTFLLLGSTSLGRLGVAILLLQAGANGLYSPLIKPLLNREIIDSRRRATALSVESMARRAAFGLFSLALGAVLELHSTEAGLLVCGLVGLAGSAVLLATARPARAGARDEDTAVPAPVHDHGSAPLA